MSDEVTWHESFGPQVHRQNNTQKEGISVGFLFKDTLRQSDQCVKRKVAQENKEDIFWEDFDPALYYWLKHARI